MKKSRPPIIVFAALGFSLAFAGPAFADCPADNPEVLKNMVGVESARAIPFTVAPGQQGTAYAGLHDTVLIAKSSFTLTHVQLPQPCSCPAGEIREAEAAPTRLDHDALFVGYAAHCENAATKEQVALIDPSVCRVASACVDRQELGFFNDADVRTPDKTPPTPEEKAFFLKVALDRGVPTKDHVLKEPGTTKWAKRLWTLKNGAVKRSREERALNVQWYPWDEAVCGAPATVGSYKQYDVIAPKPQEDALATVVACDVRKRRWTLIYVDADDHGARPEAELKGPTLTLTTATERVTIHLNGWTWKRMAKPS